MANQTAADPVPSVGLAGIAARPAAPAPSGDHAHFIFPNLLDVLRSLLGILVVALFGLTFVAQPFRIPTESMERTLLVGDFLLVNKVVFAPAGRWGWLLPYRQIQRDDVVVFHFPLDPSDHVVKRIVGIPGDRIRMRDGMVFVNGQQQSEPFAVYEQTYQDSFRDQFPSSLYTDPGVDTRWWMQMRSSVRNRELPVPPGRYFALGDNRNHSRDSRYWGFIPRANIVGRPFLIYFSLHQPSPTDAPSLPDDRLGHGKSPLDEVLDFARWSRICRIVQ